MLFVILQNLATHPLSVTLQGLGRQTLPHGHHHCYVQREAVYALYIACRVIEEFSPHDKLVDSPQNNLCYFGLSTSYYTIHFKIVIIMSTFIRSIYYRLLGTLSYLICLVFYVLGVGLYRSGDIRKLWAPGGILLPVFFFFTLIVGL